MRKVNAKLGLMQMNGNPHSTRAWIEESQGISLDNICMVVGSWTSIAQFSGCGWVWKDSLKKIQLMRTQNFKRRETGLHSEVEALR